MMHWPAFIAQAVFYIALSSYFALYFSLMKIHKEGYRSIVVAFIVFAILNVLAFYFIASYSAALGWLLFIATFVLFLFIVSFFRIPKRDHHSGETSVVAPCDGTVVVIEEVEPDEYFKEKRLQLSIFMSPLNVHVNRNPVSGEVLYSQYHPGKFLVAWHPKSSTDNERHSVVYRNGEREVLVKQIAGALAKRIVNYLKPGDTVTQGSEMGFIKFGSRVDLLLPLDTKVDVKINQKVKGGVTVLGTW
jgi:phosphatidylserine decarboxylase